MGKGIHTTTLAQLVLGVVCIIIIIVGLTTYGTKAFAEIMKMLGFDIYGDTDLKRAILCSYYRCVKGCRAPEISEVGEFMTPEGSEKECKDFCSTEWTDNGQVDGRICDENARQFPVEFASAEDIEFGEFSGINDLRCVLDDDSTFYGNGCLGCDFVFFNKDLISDSDRVECPIESSVGYHDAIKTGWFSTAKFDTPTVYISTITGYPYWAATYTQVTQVGPTVLSQSQPTKDLPMSDGQKMRIVVMRDDDTKIKFDVIVSIAFPSGGDSVILTAKNTSGGCPQAAGGWGNNEYCQTRAFDRSDKCTPPYCAQGTKAWALDHFSFQLTALDLIKKTASFSVEYAPSLPNLPNCASYTTQQTCDGPLVKGCNWCAECRGARQNVYGSGVCVRDGMCAYNCVKGGCGATCAVGSDCSRGYCYANGPNECKCG